MADMTPDIDPFGHAAAVRRLLAAFTEHDRETVDDLLAPDCVWRVPGVNSLAGDYVGRDAVIEFLRGLRRRFRAPVAFDVIDIATSPDRAIVYQYGVAELPGGTLRLKECLVYRFVDGRIVEVDEFQFDQRSFDAAFGHNHGDSQEAS